MEFDFVLYQPKRIRQSKNHEPVVEVSKSGRIVFNLEAAKLLKGHKFCMLGYDSSNNAIGVLPIAEQESNCFPIRFTAKGAYIGAKQYLKHFNILPLQPIRSSPVQTSTFIGIHLN